MKYQDRRKPYRIGDNWKIEYPRECGINDRWARFFALWRFERTAGTGRWQFVRFMEKVEADHYGRRPKYV